MNAPPTESDQRAMTEKVLHDSERLLALARTSGHVFLAFLIDNVVHEAKAILAGRGHDLTRRGADTG